LKKILGWPHIVSIMITQIIFLNGTLMASGFAPIGGVIKRINTGDTLYLTCVGKNQERKCDSYQFILKNKNQEGLPIGEPIIIDGFKEKGEIAESAKIEIQEVLNSLFMTNESCFRIKPCLKNSFMSVSPKTLKILTPFSLTQIMGERKLNEGMFGSIPLDLAMMPVTLPFHSTIAMISTIRKAYFKKVVKVLFQKNRNIKMRKSHFLNLIEEVKNN
jgi:hypothetical protein